MKWITLYLLTFCFSATKAELCENVLSNCLEQHFNWSRCYEDRIVSCTSRGRLSAFYRMEVDPSLEAETRLTSSHRIQVPPSALQRSRGADSGETVQLVASVINSTLFQQKPAGKGRSRIPQQLVSSQETVLNGMVLFLKAGTQPVSNLPEPVKLIFSHNKTENGRCVFWQEPNDADKTGGWCTEGCETTKTAEEFICSCNHLSFFAVLVNPILKVDASSAETLGYISYVGSALSAFFAFCSLFIYVHFHRRRPEKALGIHMQLTGALLCLHLGFLSSSFLVHLLKEDQGSWVCRGLGLFLHWSLLATFTWIALEGFHLYLLLIRVFNIYVSRYLLKLSIVGWGFPTLVAVICGSLGVYGRYTLEIWDSNNNTSPSQICWMSSEFQQRHVVSYITLAFLCLTVLYNTCMLLVVVSKIWKLRGGQRNCKCSDWKMNKENWSRLWKDAAKVLGLSWVLGLPWGLASLTYATLSGIYVFNILNSLQGVFIFLWAVALSCKYRSEKKSKVQDSSTQKITTSSVN